MAIVLLGSIIFVGWMLASLLLPNLSDRYGRKWIVLGAMSLNVFVMTGLMYSTNFYITVGLLFWVGVISSARMTCAYIWLLEYVSEEDEKKLGPVINAMGAVPIIAGAILAN